MQQYPCEIELILFHVLLVQHQIIYGISFTFTDENDYFYDSIEGVDTDFSIITIDTLTTIEGELDELDLYNNDDSSVTFSSDILLVGEFDDTTIDYFTADTPDELTPILDIVEDLLGPNLVLFRAKNKFDNIRRALILEPRGHSDMYGAIITEPVTKEADFGVIFTLEKLFTK